MFTYRVNDNIDLVLLESRHAEEYYALIDANREHLGQWLPWVDGTKTPDDTRAFIRNVRKRFAEKGDIVAGIRVDGKIAGFIGLEDINEALHSAEVGYWLGAEFEGKGLVTMSCRALLDYAFGEIGLQRVQIRVEPQNERSRAIPRRLGFQYEGTLRRGGLARNQPVDLEVYSILRDEWVG